MTRTYIVVTLDHHSATRALDRVTSLLDYSRDGYAVDGLTYSVYDYRRLHGLIWTAIAGTPDTDPMTASALDHVMRNIDLAGTVIGALDLEGHHEQHLPDLSERRSGWRGSAWRLRRRSVLGVRHLQARLAALRRR